MRDDGAFQDCMEALDRLSERFERFTMRRRARTDDAGWSEHKHPRDADGKFASGAGGAKKSDEMKPDPTKYNPVRAAYIKKKLEEVAHAMKSSDPVGALKNISVKEGHGKTALYIQQLIKEHEEEAANPSDPNQDAINQKAMGDLKKLQSGEAPFKLNPVDHKAETEKAIKDLKETVQKPLTKKEQKKQEEEAQELADTKKAVAQTYPNLTQEGLGLMTEAALQNKKGLITYAKYKEIAEQAKQQYSKPDASSDAKLSEIKQSLANVYPDVSDEGLTAMAKAHDLYSKGQISHDQYHQVKNEAKAQSKKGLSSETKKFAEEMKSFWPNTLPENKKKVEDQDALIGEAMNSAIDGNPQKLTNLLPLPNSPVSKSVSAMNEYLEKVKSDFGIKKEEQKLTASSLKSFAQEQETKATAAAIKSAPHKSINQTSFFEDAQGNEIESTLNVSSKNVPGDWYAKVTAIAGKNRENADNNEVNTILDKYNDDIWDKLPGKQAINAYQGSSYKSINNAAAGLNASPSALKQVAAIDSAMAKAVVPADLPVYRGLKTSLKDLTGFDNPDDAIGRCFEHKAFASVSRAETVAKNFAGSVYGDTKSRSIMKFTLPAGTPGIVMPKQGWEREILMDRNSMFRIDKVEKANGTDVIHCTYLGKRKS